jgi:tripartite ATP-independent transporter DctM subunit
VAANTLDAVPYTTTARYALLVVPMFVLLGALISNAGIGNQIFSAANRLVRRLPGGLAATTVVATAIFSGISGSTAADIAAFGRLSIIEMKKHGYGASYAAAVVAAAGTFAVLIPPSIVPVLYGIIAGESVGALLLAGIVPGVISCAALVLWVVGRGILRPGSYIPQTAPKIVDAEGKPQRASRMPREFVGLLYAAILFVIVMGGLYAGVFTATEAGAVGAFAALVIAIIASRSQSKSLLSLIRDSIRETAEVTGMIFLLLIGGAIFAYFIVVSQLPAMVTEWALDLPIPPKALVGIFLLLLIPMGMFLDGLSILLITAPVAAPLVVALGFDGVWFGILMVKLIEIGLITPPVGLSVFIACGLVDGLKVEEVFRRVLPFVVLDLAVTSIFFFFPGIVTWLPHVAGL